MGDRFVATNIKILILLLLSLTGHVQALAQQTLKPTIIFLHGSPGSSENFARYLNDSQLKKRANLLTPNRAPIKQNTKYRFRHFSDHIEHTLAAIESIPQKSPIILVGYSYGAIIALRTSQILKNRISQLILISGVYNPETVIIEWYLKLSQLPYAEHYLPKKLHQAYYDSYFLKQDLQLTLLNLNQIEAPTYIIHGQKDTLVPFADVKAVEEIHPTIYIRPNIGHDTIHKDYDFITNFLIELTRSLKQ